MSSRVRAARSILVGLVTLAFVGGGAIFNTAAAESSSVAVPKDAHTKHETSKFRLPDLATPSEYELSFEPDTDKFTFAGSETVELEISRPTREIKMNALELKIKDATVKEPGGKTRPLDVKLDSETQIATFTSKSELPAGKYELNCKFDGILNDQLRGFYRAEYKDNDGKKRCLTATHMEPSDARRMFPCFDEPAYKAVFNIRAVIAKSHTAISNAPVDHEEQSGDKKTVIFQPSPKMSSYLLALITGDLKCAGETRGGGVPIKVWAVNGKEHLGKYALSETGKILDYESKYFGVPYLGKKLDLIALPEFSAGAMENIGAITYRDEYLLFDEKTGSSFQRQAIFSVTAHEVAHQWFGDLVTMKWWEDLWLNESFATWMAAKVEDALHPEWRALTETVYSRTGAMSTDSLKATRAIHADVENPTQAREMFDGITYQKGAAVLRMLESYVGDEPFQKGITQYLKQHSFANAAAADFWGAIAAQTKAVPVAEIMHDFVYQPGYPQVNVKVSTDGKQLDLSQYRQLKLGQDKKDPTIWRVPVVLRALTGAKPEAKPEANSNARPKTESRLFDKRTEQFSLDLSGKPVLINALGRGYYKTCYEPAQLKAVRDAFEQLTAEEKITLISDCSSLVLPGDVRVEDYFDFVYKLNEEKDPMIETELSGFVSAPYHIVREKPELLKVYQPWARQMLLPLKKKLDGWNQKPGESQQTKELRLSALSMLGTDAQDKETIAEAHALFEKYAKDRKSINPDISRTVLQIVAFNGDKKDYDEILRLYRTAKTPADESRALHALDGFREPDLAKQTIALGMSKEVKLQDGLSIVCGVAHNYYTRDLGWAYIKEHWQEVLHHFPEPHLRQLGGLCTAFDTKEKETEFKAWYASHPVPFGKTTTARSLESMHASVLYRERYADRIGKWVEAQAKKAG